MLRAGIETHELLVVLLIGTWPCSLMLLIFVVCYIACLHRTLQMVKAHNRAFPPFLVWLLLVPVFNIALYVYVVLTMSRTLGAEFQERGLRSQAPSVGRGIGLLVLLLDCLAVISIFILRWSGEPWLDGLICTLAPFLAVHFCMACAHLLVVGVAVGDLRRA